MYASLLMYNERMKTLDGDTLGQNIAKLRRQKHLTQRALAVQLHTDPSMVTRWEKGKVLPRLETIEKLADVFGVPVEELMLGSSAPSWSAVEDLGDPELQEMLSQIGALEARDREALKAVLEAMLTRAKLKAFAANPVQSRQAS